MIHPEKSEELRKESQRTERMIAIILLLTGLIVGIMIGYGWRDNKPEKMYGGHWVTIREEKLKWNTMYSTLPWTTSHLWITVPKIVEGGKK
jgi:hypothetical protein